ncbi:MAG: HAD family hydrolase [Planctomycetota bacterium]|jgi:phosphoglycolate phosphatase
MHPAFAKRTVDALLFDLDGTLIDSAEDLAQAYIEAFRIAGFDPPASHRVYPLLGAPLEEMTPALGYHFSPDETERLFRAFRQYYAEHWTDRTRPYPGVTELLPALEKHFRLAVVTTKRQLQADRLTRALGIADPFRHVQGWQEGLRHKPAPDLPRAALAALGVAPQNALMVGDTPRDILAGKAAGCGTIAVSYGAGDVEALRAAGPDALADSFSEILSHLGVKPPLSPADNPGGE